MNDTPDRTAPRWLGFLALLAACGSGSSTLLDAGPDAHPFCMPPDGGGCMELPDCDPLAAPGQTPTPTARPTRPTRAAPP